MIEVLLILYLITLLYLSVANRLLTFTKILSIQGFLLFLMVYFQLKNFEIYNLILILIETIGIKTIAIPIFLEYLIKKNNIKNETESYVSNFISLVITIFIFILSTIITISINDPYLKKVFFITALTSLFLGLFIITSRKKIITHVMGYIIIENGIFILSIAVGNEMPTFVNLGVIFDVFASIFLLGIFLNKIGNVFQDVDIDNLTNLKDY